MTITEPPHEFYELLGMARAGQLQPFIMKNKVYSGVGCATSRSVYVDHGAGIEPLDPRPSQALCNHSPDGFNWGFGGSGPAQLALAILLDFTGKPDLAEQYYHEFKWQVVAQLGDKWKVTGREVMDWLRRQGVSESDLA